MRQGEVLETVPGVIITQHSGEGKANQYFLRGFNLDHGSDFAMTVAGTPVNMPTHAHSQGYSDINFLIPELVAGVQYSKGPYFADQGDFATAGAGNINYATVLDRADLLTLETGTYDFARGLFAASPKVGKGQLLMAVETSTNSGPWTIPDSYRKFNGVLRYSQGDNTNGFSLTAMGYRGKWNATEASPERAIDSGLIDRFGSHRPDRRRPHLSLQRRRRVAAQQRQHAEQDSGLRARLRPQPDLELHVLPRRSRPRRPGGAGRSPVRHRGARVPEAPGASGAATRCRTPTACSSATTTSGRSRCITPKSACGSRREERRVRARHERGGYAENEIEWTPMAAHARPGLRVDGSRYDVTNRIDDRNSGVASAGIVSPKGGVTLRPVALDRVLRQRRHRLPQQQRARHDDQVRRQRQRRPIRSRRSCAPRAPRSACAPSPCRTCRARSRCGRCASARSWSTTATSAPPSPGRPASATASSSPTTTAPSRG